LLPALAVEPEQEQVSVPELEQVLELAELLD
jgi:hypothetical protein